MLLSYAAAAHLHLHSFPTRRSSDLADEGGSGDCRRVLGTNRLLPGARGLGGQRAQDPDRLSPPRPRRPARLPGGGRGRSEEHTSELQSLTNLVCRLLLEKKKDNRIE